MKITNFENYVNKTILHRGYSYYVEGNVLEAYKQDENVYIFQIEGGDAYEVVVEIGDDGEIFYSECDCPYDFGPVCKHEVAAYFQLSNMLKKGTSNKKIINKSQNPTSIQEVLNNLSKEELIDIIINITDDDATLENSLIVRYSKGDRNEELTSCKEYIDSVVKKYTGREGFIKYRDTRAFVGELDDVVEKARHTEDDVQSLDIALLLLEEAIGAFQYADDSAGDIGMLVTETIGFIGGIAINSIEKGAQRGQIFEKLLDLVENEIFDGWEDYKIDVLDICYEFADDKTLREKLRLKIESMINTKSSSRYGHYTQENLLQLLFRMTEEYGTQEEAEKFIQNHIQFSSFREKLLINYLHDKNYHQVIELALNGEKQDHQYPGLISKWQNFRYEAYKKLGFKEEQRILAKELLMGGDFEYYQDLRELAESNFEDFYINLKEELKLGKGWHSMQLFLKLLEEENDLEEIMEFVKDNPSYIENYAEKLVEDFHGEVINVYKKYIYSAANTSSNRREYQWICRKINSYKKIAGISKQVELIHELMGLYKRRPAFIDELGKI